jgi:hypothetical protein
MASAAQPTAASSTKQEVKVSERAVEMASISGVSGLQSGKRG